MAYNSRRFIRHIDDYNRVHRLEIQQLDFAGSEASMKANKESGAFKFEHEDVTDENDYLKIYANPIQKGMLEVYPLIENSTDYGLLTDIFQSDENEFRLVWKIDGSVFWTGYVLNDLLEFEESGYPYTSTIVAKDFSRLKGMDYGLDDTRQTWITTIADLLSNLDLGLGIETATSWTEEHLDNSLTGNYDYLNHIYHETKALREFARTGDETPQPITVYEALEHILSDNCLILKQIDGKYQIDQLSAYDDPANVLVSTYDSTGTQTAQTTEDKTLTYDRNLRRVKSNGSTSKGFVAIKQARVKYDHRTKVSNIQFPTSVVMDSSNQGPESFSQFFISDGGQEIDFAAEANARWDSGVTSASVRWEVKVGGYWWDDDNSNLASSQVVNENDLTITDETPSFTDSLVTIRINIPNIPSDADGAIEVILYRAQGDSTNQETRWRHISLDIVNPVALENSTSINYQLTQSAGFSEEYDHPDAWFGDGPIGYSVGALRYSSADNDTTSDSWQRRGTTTGYRNYHENVLKEIIDIQRAFIFRKEAAMWGLYDPTEVLQYRSGNYYYTGGSFSGARGDWNVRIMGVNIQTGTDTFEDIPKFTDETGSGSGSTGGGGSGGGIDQGTADARYFRQANNLSEGDPATIRSNIDVYSTTEAHNQFLDEALNLSDLSNIATARSNLDVYSTGEADNTFLEEANNLSDLTNITTAQQNLGLTDGSADLHFNSLRFANHEWGDFDTDGDVYHDASAGLYVKSINASNDKVGGNLLWSSGNFTAGTGLSVGYDSEDEPTMAIDLVGGTNIGITGNTIDVTPQGAGSGLDADLWDGNQFSDYLDQPVRTTDDVSFQQITVIGDIIFNDTSRTINYIQGPSSRSLGVQVHANGPEDVFQVEIDSDGGGNFINTFSVGRDMVTSVGTLRITHADTDTFSTIEGPNNRSLRFDLRDNDDLDSFLFRNLAGDSLMDVSRTGDVEVPNGKITGGTWLELGINSRTVTPDILLNQNANISSSGTSTSITFLTELTSRSTNGGGLFNFGYGSTVQDGTESYILTMDDVSINAEIPLVLDDWAGTSSYTSGILGSGTIWDMDDVGGVGRTFFEIDNMRVRNALRVHIFMKDIVRASNGFLMITDSAQIAENKVLADNTAGQTLRIDKGDGNSTFSVGDLLWAKNIDESGGGLTVNGLQATITAIDTNPADYVELTLDTGSGGNGGEVFDGDTIVRVSGPNILNDASSTNAPFLDMYSGVNTWGDFYQNNTGNDKLKVRLGRLDGVTRQGVNLTGFGLFSERVRLTQDILVGDFTETSNYLKFDGTSFTVDADIFELDSGAIHISDTHGTDGVVRVGHNLSSAQVGMAGMSAGADVGFWAGAFYGNRDTAPVRIYGNGEFHLGGSGSNFLDSSGGVLTADFNDITFTSNTFHLTSGNLLITDQDSGRIEAGGSSNRAGMTAAESGTGGSDSISFWAGGLFADRETAAVRIKRGGDFHFSAGGSGFIDSTSGVLTADFDDISFSSTTFDLSANGLSITTADGIDVGSDFWHNDNTFQFGGGILTGTASSVDLAGFTANATELSRTVSTYDIRMGNVRSSIEGFGVTQDSSNEIWMGKVGNDDFDFEFQVTVGGTNLVRLGSRVNIISDWDILSTAIRKNDIDINSAVGAIRVGYGSSLQAGLNSSSNAGDTAIWAGETWSNRGVADFRVTYGGVLNATGATIEGHIDALTGSLGDLDVTGDLTMTTSGLITDNSNFQISGSNGLDFIKGSGSLNAIQWHDADFTSNADIYSEIYSYRDTSTIFDINRLVLRSVSYNADRSDIYLTATQLQVHADAWFNNNVRINDGVFVRFNTGSYLDLNFGRASFRLPVHTNANLPSNPDTGQFIFNSDENRPQFADNNGDWKGLQVV